MQAPHDSAHDSGVAEFGEAEWRVRCDLAACYLPALFRWGFARLAAAGRPTVLYVHPWEIDPDQPRQPVSRRIRINHYHNLDATEARLARLLERFEFQSLGDVLDGLEASGRLSAYRFPEGSDRLSV